MTSPTVIASPLTIDRAIVLGYSGHAVPGGGRCELVFRRGRHGCALVHRIGAASGLLDDVLVALACDIVATHYPAAEPKVAVAGIEWVDFGYEVDFRGRVRPAVEVVRIEPAEGGYNLMRKEATDQEYREWSELVASTLRFALRIDVRFP